MVGEGEVVVYPFVWKRVEKTSEVRSGFLFWQWSVLYIAETGRWEEPYRYLAKWLFLVIVHLSLLLLASTS